MSRVIAVTILMVNQIKTEVCQHKCIYFLMDLIPTDQCQCVQSRVTLVRLYFFSAQLKVVGILVVNKTETLFGQNIFFLGRFLKNIFWPLKNPALLLIILSSRYVDN